jgi:branched-chain amino acid transport system substrate-binding protein
MKRLFILLFGASLMTIGCDVHEGPPGVTNTEIIIGNVQDLSGPMKELGKLLPSGSNLYFDYVNQGGGVYGRKIRMLVEDGQYNPQKTLTAVKKLIEKDKVFCLYNVIGTSSVEAVRPLLEEAGIPLVAPATQSGTMSDMSRQGARYIFHTDTGYDRQASILTEYALGMEDNLKIGLIYQDDDYGENVLKGIGEAETKFSISVQKESFQRGASEFTGQVMNLIKGGCTHVIIAGIVKEPIIIMKTASRMGYFPQFLGISPTMDHRVALAAGAAGEGFISVNFAQLWNSNYDVPNLYRELCQKAGIPEKMMGMYHYYGFSTAMVLVEGLKRAGKMLTRNKLISGLESLKNWDGAGIQQITYNRNDHSGAEAVMLIQVNSGVQVPISGWLK